MAQQTINIGTAPNDGTGTPLRTAFDYCNLNFTELYTAVGPSGNNIVVPGTATITGNLTAARLIVTGGTIPTNGVWLPTTNTLEFAANSLAQYRIAPLGVFSWYDGAGGTRMTLNSTGLGVGVSPAAKLHMSDNTGSPAFRLNGAATANNGPFIEFYKNNVRTMLMGNESLLVGGGSTSNNFGFYNDGAFDFRWYINGTVPKMTLDASGNLLVGKTSASITTDGFQTLPSGEASVAMSATTGAATTLNVYSTGAAAYRFFVGMNGTISATNTTISAISDARFKENVQDIDVGLGAILALKPRKFDWKTGKGKDIKGDRGFIAQEFEQVFPQLVDEWKDPAPEGEAPYKSVRQDLIPVLVKAIQELAVRVQTLEAK